MDGQPVFDLAHPFVSLRIVSLDYYMAVPHPSLDGQSSGSGSTTGSSGSSSTSDARTAKVPVIRIFGSSPAGQKICLHLHQIYPYLYIPYRGPAEPQEDKERYIVRLGLSINQALHFALNANGKSRYPPNHAFVAAIVLVKGIAYYGFHAGYSLFLKISLFDPGLITRLATLLQSGAVLGSVFDVLEAHIPYLLQFLVDYNLHGMDYLHLSYARFRTPILQIRRRSHAYEPLFAAGAIADNANPNLAPLQVTIPNAIHPDVYWTRENQRPEWRWPDHYRIRRQSSRELELDSWPGEILNRLNNIDLQNTAAPTNLAPSTTSNLPSRVHTLRDPDAAVASNIASEHTDFDEEDVDALLAGLSTQISNFSGGDVEAIVDEDAIKHLLAGEDMDGVDVLDWMAESAEDGAYGGDGGISLENRVASSTQGAVPADAGSDMDLAAAEAADALNHQGTSMQHRDRDGSNGNDDLVMDEQLARELSEVAEIYDVYASDISPEKQSRLSLPFASAYFTESIQELWSPIKSTAPERPAFYFDPPTASSPTKPILPAFGTRPDPIRSMFYCIQSSDETRFKSNGRCLGYHVGMLVVADGLNPRRSGLGGFEVTTVQTERELLQTLVELVREWDPDMLVGFEIQSASWGYAMMRAEAVYQLDLCQGLAAIQDDTARAHHEADQDAWGAKKQSSLHATGRIFLNVWRLLKHELALTSYSLENLAFHVLHKRIPKFSHQSTTAWWEGGLLSRWRTIKYFIERVQDNLELLDATELINRTSEFAKVYGIDIYSVVSRGSQFRVESVMARITRPENYLMFSPSKEQIRKMRAFECLPLTMEPRTELYTSPMLVLDFQSLYPSMIIAYNMCFSTVLGRVETLGKHEALGAQSLYQIPVGLLERLRDHVNVTPNGVVFVKPHIREGVLGRMLNEILETRVMVKKSMKLYKDNKGLLRVLDAKQLGLKLLANVTYGYTAASYSGRMPCSEIADSIVQSGRVTLERAIRMINATERWGANVVYGDTDSIFVQLQGRTKEEAFAIGNEMVNAATRANPDPIKLKFEKVYLPCVLLAKKRYVGFAFETVEQKEPVFDAKGIETVRRDGCPAVAKMMEQSLKHISLEDFIIAKGVKLGTYSAKGPLPPGAHLSSKRMAQDHMAEPQYGERVPYVVVHGGPRDRLVDAVVSPDELLLNRALRLHGTYYITKQIIPALARVFNLVGA
ncbi:hypothetical protein BC831DRAFT_517231, partial [Entophlyctis helioformis]